MTLSHRYSDFGDLAATGDEALSRSESSLEDEKLQAFENGYQAGWDDAVKAHADDQGRIAADFAQNLQEMSFTYVEASAKLTRAMRPLMEQIVTKLLPELARQTLGLHLLEQLDALADAQLADAIEITVSPSNLDAMSALMETQPNAPFTLKTEAALSEGQVYLRVGGKERQINLDAVTKGIGDALEAFFDQAGQEPSNG
jgi:flagellar assembly protein FliH